MNNYLLKNILLVFVCCGLVACSPYDNLNARQCSQLSYDAKKLLRMKSYGSGLSDLSRIAYLSSNNEDYRKAAQYVAEKAIEYEMKDSKDISIDLSDFSSKIYKKCMRY